MINKKEFLERMDAKTSSLTPEDRERTLAYVEGAAAVRESLRRKKAEKK